MQIIINSQTIEPKDKIYLQGIVQPQPTLAVDAGCGLIYYTQNECAGIIRVACVGFDTKPDQGKVQEYIATGYTDTHKHIKADTLYTYPLSMSWQDALNKTREALEKNALDQPGLMLSDGIPHKGVVVYKTTQLQSDQDIFATLHQWDERKSYYYKIGATCIAKLHPHANQFFRVDLPSEADAQRALEILQFQCDDISFLGYPYSLVKADELARVSKEECETHPLLLNLSKEKQKAFAQYKTHDVLDNIRY